MFEKGGNNGALGVPEVRSDTGRVQALPEVRGQVGPGQGWGLGDALPTLAPEPPFGTLGADRDEMPESGLYDGAKDDPQQVQSTPVIRFAPPPTAAPVDAEGWVTLDDLSFYVCDGAPAGFQDGYCDSPAGPLPLNEGQVACGYAWQIGNRFQIESDPTGRTYVCNDRGRGPSRWLDVFFWHYADGRAFVDSLKWPWRVRVVP